MPPPKDVLIRWLGRQLTGLYFRQLVGREFRLTEPLRREVDATAPRTGIKEGVWDGDRAVAGIDLCSVKVSETLNAGPYNQCDRGEMPGQRPFWRLIAPRQISVLFTVMWTRCGREPKPAKPSTGDGPSRIDAVNGSLRGHSATYSFVSGTWRSVGSYSSCR